MASTKRFDRDGYDWLSCLLLLKRVFLLFQEKKKKRVLNFFFFEVNNLCNVINIQFAKTN